MTTYAVGDLQGCFEPLQTLLNYVNFDASKDELWVAGDLVNRGPDSLKCLQFIKSLGPSAKVILGNHDLHLLAIYHGIKPVAKQPTLVHVIESSECDELIEWLAQQPLLHYDEQLKTVMTHAGLPHIWNLEQAQNYAKEIETCLTNPKKRINFLSHMYGNAPALWSNSLQGNDRMRTITNYFTRMRFIKADGTLDFDAKESLDAAPEGFKPWFSFYENDESKGLEQNYIFGHWAALMGKTQHPRIHGLDTGFVWGNQLTLMNIETKVKYSVDQNKEVTSTSDV